VLPCARGDIVVALSKKTPHACAISLFGLLLMLPKAKALQNLAFWMTANFSLTEFFALTF